MAKSKRASGQESGESSKKKKPTGLSFSALVAKNWKNFRGAKNAKSVATVLVDSYKQCKAQEGSRLCDGETYTGPATFTGPGIRFVQISAANLDAYKSYKIANMEPVPDDTWLNEVLGAEYATNIEWINVELKVKSTKYITMELLPSQEMSMDMIDEKGAIHPFLIDFAWNVFELELRTPDQFLKFMTAPPRYYDVFLFSDEVAVLNERGEHEEYEEEDREESIKFLKEINKFLVEHYGGPPLDE